MRLLLTLSLLVLAGCATMPATLTAPAPAAPSYVKSSKLIGTTTYEGGTEVQPDALVVVQLVGTDAEGKVVVLGSHRLVAGEAQVPFSFEIPYARNQLSTVQNLQVYAEILDGLGQARWSAAAPLHGDVVPSRYDMFLQPVRLTQKDG